ncbi:MAG: phosphoribosyltransferase family protein [Anaerolineae bacterium]|nr:phosphoribosyltransferase family protein [Anaerolineae bacterium]
MFEDRTDAGKRLAAALANYWGQDVVVLAVPRGGVEVGYQVARYLNADFSLLVSRKLPYPDNPEAGFGALAEDGSAFISEQAARWIPSSTVQRIVEEQKRELTRRVQVLRGGAELPRIEGRTVILVDDGIAMGSTMRASIQLCRNRKAAKVVVATPVAGESVARQIMALVDELVILEMPPLFRAVAQVYQNWYDVSDQEVLQTLEKWQSEHPASRWSGERAGDGGPRRED